MLHTYWEAPIDWMELWAIAATKRDDLPEFAASPYWVAAGPQGAYVPLSRLAFMSVQERLDVAEAPETDPSSLQMMAKDPAPEVRAAALDR